MQADASALNAVSVQCLTTKAVVLLPAPLVDEPENIVRRAARDQARDVVEMDPSTPGYLATRACLGLPGYFAGEHMMVFLLAANVEQIPGCLSGEPGLLPEFS